MDELCIGTSLGEMCDFSLSSVVDVVETKSGISDIVSAQKGIVTGLSSVKTKRSIGNIVA